MLWTTRPWHSKIYLACSLHLFHSQCILFAGRIKDTNQKRILDSYTRAKRLRKQLEALEQDNYQEDPQANLVIPNKKLPQFDSNEGSKFHIERFAVTPCIDNL